MAAERATAIPEQLAGITARDFTLARLQVTVFTPDEEISGAKLARTLLPKWEQWFDGERFLMPTVGPLPREVPRAILQSQDGAWRCEISSERVNIYWQKTSADADMPNTFGSQAIQLLDEYTATFGARVGRLAAVMTRFAPHPSPGRFLAEHFCDKRWLVKPFNRPENFEIHAHKVFFLAQKFTVNSWVRTRTAHASGPTATLPGISVEQDLNTLQEESGTRQFSSNDIQSFASAALPEFDAILSQYFPTEEHL